MILFIRRVSKSFGGVKALSGCSMEIERGKITALIGPNGSGKSTLFSLISHLEEADSGSIVFGGVDITQKTDVAVARLGVSRTFQDVRFFRYLTIEDHLRIAMSSGNESLFSSFFGSVVGENKNLQTLLTRVRLVKPLTTMVSELSYGQRKLLDLAIALAKPHTLLLLDEPVAGVNPAVRSTLREVLLDLRTMGESIFLIEHDMNFVMDLADMVYVLDEGKVIAQGPPRVVQKNKQVLEAYLGE